jgi:hypothetical protein
MVRSTARSALAAATRAPRTELCHACGRRQRERPACCVVARGRSLYFAGVADLPFALHEPLDERFAAVFDVEGKVPRALEILGPISGRDVLLYDSNGGRLASRLTEFGARVKPAPDAAPRASADVFVASWSSLSHPTPEAERGHQAADRGLRPGGRLLLLEDYGRDEAARVMSDPAAFSPAALRQRDAWFVARGFKIHVVHAWWTFPAIEDARGFLGDAFGDRGQALGESLKRPRISHKLVVYHRTCGGAASAKGGA